MKKADNECCLLLLSIDMFSGGEASDGALYLARTETTGTNVNRLGCSVNNSLDLADIRLPHSVRLAIRVGNVMTEGYALVAYAALCHVNYTSILNSYINFYHTNIVRLTRQPIL
jgi:hypothetical protein